MIDLKLMSKNGEMYAFRTSSYAFLNPYNDEFEFIVLTFTLQKSSDMNNSVLMEQLIVPNNNTINGVESGSMSTNYVNLQTVDKTSQEHNTTVSNSYAMNTVDSSLVPAKSTQDAYLYASSNTHPPPPSSSTATLPLPNQSSFMPALTQFNQHMQPTNLQWSSNYYDSTSTTTPLNTNTLDQTTLPINNQQQQTYLISQQQYMLEKGNTASSPSLQHQQYTPLTSTSSDWPTTNANDVHLNQNISTNFQHNSKYIKFSFLFHIF